MKKFNLQTDIERIDFLDDEQPDEFGRKGFVEVRMRLSKPESFGLSHGTVTTKVFFTDENMSIKQLVDESKLRVVGVLKDLVEILESNEVPDDLLERWR